MNDFRKNSPIDSKSAGRRNEIMILTMLRKHGRLSQTELCRLAQIGSSTASTIVARLRDKGLVVETRGLSERRGPKPSMLELNPQSLYVIGAEISPSYLYIGLFNFIGQMKDKTRIPLGLDHSVRHVLELLNRHIPEIINRGKLDLDQILGAGFTLSGSVSADGSISLSSPMGWKDVPLKQKLGELFSFPVRVYSNRVRLLAEFEIEPALEAKNILYLNVANGVGATVYMNGRLMFGATGRYGEIGHTVVDPEGPQCGCGHVGCLEAFISGPALSARIMHDYQQGQAAIFTALLANEKQPTPEELVAFWGEAVKDHDNYAIQLRQEVANLFADAAALAINSYDPDVVILGGYISLLFADFFTIAIRQKMLLGVYDNQLRDIQIIPARAGENAVIKGVAAAVLQDCLKVSW